MFLEMAIAIFFLKCSTFVESIDFLLAVYLNCNSHSVLLIKFYDQLGFCIIAFEFLMQGQCAD